MNADQITLVEGFIGDLEFERRKTLNELSELHQKANLLDRICTQTRLLLDNLKGAEPKSSGINPTP